MPEDQELITSYIDLGAVGAQTDAFLGQIKKLNDAYDSLAQKGVNLGGLSSSKEITSQIKDLQNELGRLQKAKQDVLDVDLRAQKVATESARTRQQDAKATAEQARSEIAIVNAKEKTAKASATSAKAAAGEAKAAADLSNAYKQLTIQYNASSLAAKNIGIQFGTNSTQFKTAAANASALKDQIRALDLATGNTSTSIGRYNEGIKQVEVNAGGAFAGISKFYGFIRVAANILPGLGISGVFLAAFEAIKFAAQGLGFFNETVDKSAEKIAKQKKEMEDLVGSFRSLDEITAAAEGNSEGTIVHVQALATAVTDQTKSYDERNRALTELKEINKAYFGDLTLETATLELLTKVVNEYTDAIVNQAVLKELEGDIGKVTVAYSRQIKVVEDLNTKVKQVQSAFDSLNPNKLPSELGITNKTLENFGDLKNNLVEQANALKPLAKQYDDLRQEIIDATNAGLKFKDLNPKKEGGSGDKNNTRLKTFDAKENEDAAKRFIQLEKDISAALDTELNTRLGLRQDAYSREFNLLTQSVEQEKKVAQDAANDVLNDPKANNNTKENARRKLHADLETIDNNFNAADLKLQEDFERDYDRIISTNREKRKADEKRDNDAFLAAAKATYQARLDLADKQNEDLLNNRKSARDISITSINDEENALREKNGFLTEKQEKAFNDKRLAAETLFLRLSLGQLVDYYKKIIELRKANGEDVTKLEAALEAARRAQSEQRTKEDAKQEKDQLDIYDKRVKALQKLIGYARQFSEILRGAFDASIDTQKNALQDQSDQIDINKKKEIDAINASTDAASVKADKIAIINARTQAQKEEIDRKQRQLDQQKARFDKALTIANIIQETALAVVRALGSKPYTPANIGLAALTAALGAAQLAVAIATPIPKYKYGTQNHPGGIAEVGHGQPEYVLMPSGKGFITGSTPVHMDLPAGTKVYPDLDKLPADIMRMAMRPLMAMPQQGYSNPNDGVIKELRYLASVVKNKPVLQQKATRGGLQALWVYGQSWTQYVNEQTKF